MTKISLEEDVLKKKRLLCPCHAVASYNFDKSKQCVGTMTVEVDFLQKKNVDSSPYDTDKMAAEFIQHFNSQAFSKGQQVREGGP